MTTGAGGRPLTPASMVVEAVSEIERKSRRLGTVGAQPSAAAASWPEIVYLSVSAAGTARALLAVARHGTENGSVVAVRALTVILGLALGALCAVGVLVAVLFERDGFGDRDGEPSTAYLLALAVGLVASVGLPLVLWRMLLPNRFSWPAVLTAVVVAAAGVIWVLGISLAG